MNLKLVFSVAASVVSIVAYYPYIRDIFRKKTKPHIYTWLIWSIISGIAVGGIFLGDDSVESIVGIVTIFLLDTFIAILAIKFGTKNITYIDTVAMLVSLVGIAVWLKMDNLLLALILITVIDLISYFPTYRKSWSNPEEETVSYWLLMSFGYGLIIPSLASYNFFTTFYVTCMTIASFGLVIVLKVRNYVRLKKTNL